MLRQRRLRHLQSLLDLPSLFAGPPDIRRRVRDLLDQRRAWRGEVRLEAGDEAGRAVLVRADPVLATPAGCWASCCCSPI